MSFNPLTIPSVAYIGAPFVQPTKLCTPQIEAPAMVPLNFIWANYGVSQLNPDVTVPIDVNVGASKKLISSIRGVYIDNTQSAGSVYVYFPDTKMNVVCGPYATAFQPVMTGGLQCLVIGKGFGTNDPSQTNVFLLNTPINPGNIVEIQKTYPQWAASAAYSQNGFNTPALGDQFQFIKSPGQNGTVDTALFGTPYTQGGTIILTSFTMYYGLQTIAASNLDCSGSVFSDGSQGTFFDFEFTEEIGSSAMGQLNLANMQSMQVRLNAADSWKYRVTADGIFKGNLRAHFTYCYEGPQIVTIGTFGTSNNAVSGKSSIDNTNPKAGIQFTAGLNCEITSAQLFIGGGSSGQTLVKLKLYTNSAGSPSVLLGTSEQINVQGSADQVNFNFLTPVALASGTLYWLVWDNQEAYGGDNYNLETCGNIAGYASGKGATIAGLTANLAVDYRVNFAYRTQ